MAQGKSDGTVYIDTKIDTSGIGKGVENVKSKMNSVTNSVKKFGESVNKAFTASPSGNMGRTYEEVAKDIKKAEIQLDKLIEKQIRFVETGGDRQSRTFAGMEYDIEMARNKLAGLKEELSSTSKKAPKSMSILKKGVDNTTKSIKKMGDTAKKSNFSLLKMLGTSLLFSIVFRAISTITQGFVEGLNNLVLYSDEANSTMSSLKSSLTQLKNSFAAAFMPIITFIAPAINKLIAMIIRVNDLIAQFFAAISGKNTYTKAAKVQEDYADSLKETAGAAEETKKSLSGLDKLNVLSSNKDTGGGSAEIPKENIFEEAKVDNKLLEIVDKLKSAFEELSIIFKKGFFDGLGDFSSRIDLIKDGLHSIKESLIEIFTDSSVVNASKKYVKSLIYMFGQITGAIASIGLTIGANLIGGLALYLESNKERIKEYLTSMFDIKTDINTYVGDWFSSIAYIFESWKSEGGLKISEDLIGIFASIFMSVSELGHKFTRDMVKIFMKPISESKEELRKSIEDFLGGFSGITEYLRTVFEDTGRILNEVYDQYFAPFFRNISDNISKLLKENISPMISEMGKLFKSVGEALTEIWENVFKPFINWLIDKIMPKIMETKNKTVDIFSKMVGTIADLTSGLFKVLRGIIDFISGVFSRDWKKAWNGIKTAFSGIWDSLKSVIKNPINGIIGIINKLVSGVTDSINLIIRSINRLDFDIPDWVPKIGGEHVGFSIPEITAPKIPYLASGAVIPPNAPFMAMLGDQRNGKNLEAPENLIRQIMREELSSIGVNVTFEVEGDPNGIFKVTQKKAREFKKRTGQEAYA